MTEVTIKGNFLPLTLKKIRIGNPNAIISPKLSFNRLNFLFKITPFKTQKLFRNRSFYPKDINNLAVSKATPLIFNFLISILRNPIFVLILFVLFSFSRSNAQNPTITKDTFSTQTGVFPHVSTQDTLKPDTTGIQPTTKKSSNSLEATVNYKCTDSLHFKVKNRQTIMYKAVDINYEKINLKADYVEVDFKKNQVFAKGLPDSTGKLRGTPVFTEGDQSFKSTTLSYNYKTRKGVIEKVITQDGEGYLHGERVKKMPDDVVYQRKGMYTTCNAEHPHFAFKFNKAKVIPGDKIISGPAYLTIQDVPTPLLIPFGYFPNKKNQRSGIIIPTYGESANRGFYLERGGYYWAINDYLDLTLTGDIYTRGSWRVNPQFRYAKRYKYSGNLDLAIARNVSGEPGDPGYFNNRDFSIRWSHRQDPKARPNSNFSANVNIVSNKYNKYNPGQMNDYFSNTFQSSISYQTRIGDNYNLTINANHSQNTSDKSVNISLPQITFTANRFTPFKRKNPVGRTRWYENISISYSANAENRISTYDSLLFKPQTLKKMKNGVRHSIPISSSVKILKHLNLTNSININERWYFQTINKYWVDTTGQAGGNTPGGYVQTDTVYGFKAAHDFTLSSSLNTRLYGMYSFKYGPVKAIRHVMNPSVSFSYNPDFSSPFWGYYKQYQKDAQGNMAQYSIFEGGIYGSPPTGKAGRISFSISNNLEMKVRNRKDTLTGMKKVALIDNFTISTSYDLTRDSLRWSKVQMSGRTTLFKNLTINYSSSWDPYILDSAGTQNLNQFEWKVNRRFLRLDNTNWNLSLNYSLQGKSAKSGKGTPPGMSPNDPEYQDYLLYPESYVDFDLPWRLSFAYTLNYTANHKYPAYKEEVIRKVVQTLMINGDLSLAPRWKIAFSTGYDFERKKLSQASINIYRDLHCWEMRFNWIPIGYLKSWNFQINVKSAMLQDLKLTKKKDFRDR